MSEYRTAIDGRKRHSVGDQPSKFMGFFYGIRGFSRLSSQFSLRGVTCPSCHNPPTNYFQTVSSPAYDRACDHARRGEKDAALVALEEALKNGMDLEIVDSDPALAKLRSDPRWTPLLKKYRPR
jgi:hypothetical protein